MEFVYVPVSHVSTKLTSKAIRIPVYLNLPATNTRGATPQKGMAQVIDKGKSKVVDKGKGKMVVPKKPKKAKFIPLQTGGAFKIYEPKDLIPSAPLVTQPAKKSPILKNKPVNTSPLVARLLKLVDEKEEREAQQPFEAALRPISLVSTPSEESEVKVIEAPLVKKRKLVKGVEAIAPTVDEA
jgi:hypothetical protein